MKNKLISFLLALLFLLIILSSIFIISFNNVKINNSDINLTKNNVSNLYLISDSNSTDKSIKIICHFDMDCNDNNSNTSDRCIKPNKYDSYCIHELIVKSDSSNDKHRSKTSTVNNSISNNNQNNTTVINNTNNRFNNSNDITVTCYNDYNCGTNINSDNFCSGNNVVNNQTVYTCNNPGTVNSSCSNSTSQQKQQICSYQCSNAVCVNPPSVCGNGIKEGNEQCDDGNTNNNDSCSNLCLTQNITCNNDSQCDDNNDLTLDSCLNAGLTNSSCKYENIDIQVYLVPYVGDIDGSINSDWYFFYDKLREWHEQNQIPTGLSFYPSTMNNEDFNKIIGRMYSSKNIELVLKTEGEINGTNIDTWNYDRIRLLIDSLDNKYVSELENLGYTNVKKPVSYNQQFGRFTPTIRDAIKSLDYKIYIEQYVSELGYVELLPDFDITQYSVSFTKSGHPGPNEEYKTADEMMNEVINFDNSHLVYINGVKVVPLLAHQQDFLINDNDVILNQSKWDTYTEFLLKAKADKRIKIIFPKDVYDLRHHS